MAVTGLDHVYAETHDWDSSVAFWGTLGFSFADRWGSVGHRAGRPASGSAIVVLAEVPADRAPAYHVFFAMDEDHVDPGPEGELVTPLEDTHWGTRWIRVTDPEGRVHCFEEGTA